MNKIDTHHIRIQFGKHKGELFTRIPRSYLVWMINERTRDWEIAQAEFERRGDTLPTVEITGHAIDNASIRVRKTWHQTKKNDDEGLYTWLTRMVHEAMTLGEEIEPGKYRYNKMKLIIEKGAEFPVLKTIMRG